MRACSTPKSKAISARSLQSAFQRTRAARCNSYVVSGSARSKPGPMNWRPSMAGGSASGPPRWKDSEPRPRPSRSDMLQRPIFDEEHDQFRDTVRKWAEKNVFPYEDAWRCAGMVSREVWRSAGEQGFLAMYVDEQFGGQGIDDYRFDQILVEELTARSPGLFIPLHNRVVGPYIQKFGTVEQKARLCPGIVSGETILAIAMTEPDAGSDLAGIRTRADYCGDHWVLNGSKTYVSNGILAGLVVVAARTEPFPSRSIGLFLVEDGMPGFRR